MKLPFGWYLVKPFDRKTTADRNTFAGREELERQHMRALDHLLEADDYVVATIHPHASGKRAAATTIISLPRHWEAVAFLRRLAGDLLEEADNTEAVIRQEGAA